MLPNDWVGGMIAQLERFDGDIDALVSRIAHVRTWTYMSHRASWLADAAHWQERAREVEDRLSDALHERLTQRFVDRRTSALVRSLREKGEHDAAVVDPSGEVSVDGHVVGRIDGLNLTIVGSDDLEADRRLLAAAARAALPALRRKAAELVAAGDAEFCLDERDAVRWRDAVVARLRPGPGVLAPRVEPVLDGASTRRPRTACGAASSVGWRLGGPPAEGAQGARAGVARGRARRRGAGDRVPAGRAPGLPPRARRPRR